WIASAGLSLAAQCAEGGQANDDQITSLGFERVVAKPFAPGGPTDSSRARPEIVCRSARKV
ncbi:MAG: hypothetical protein WCB62_18890, partial [Pseudolabrys sp.]